MSIKQLTGSMSSERIFGSLLLGVSLAESPYKCKLKGLKCSDTVRNFNLT